MKIFFSVQIFFASPMISRDPVLHKNQLAEIATRMMLHCHACADFQLYKNKKKRSLF